MKLPNIFWISPFLTLLAACGSASSTDRFFTVKGKATTGAHTATPVSAGNIGTILPNHTKFYVINFPNKGGIPNKVVTSSDGSFTYKVDLGALTYASSYPTFIGVSDSSQTFTMMVQIPYDLAIENAELALDINPTTTAAAQLICPGGKYPPPSGAYCYSDPKTSTSSKSFKEAITTALAGVAATLETGTPPNWTIFMTTLLSNTTTFDALKAIATSAGLTSTAFTKTAIPNTIGALPLVVAPVASDNNDPGTVSTSSCKMTWNCGSSSQCAAAFGGSATGSTDQTSAAECQSFLSSSCSGGACKCEGCD